LPPEALATADRNVYLPDWAGRLRQGYVGVWPARYERLLAALADPADPERPELLEWLGGEFHPDDFDVAATDDLLELYDRHTRQRTRR
jgi:hypothetical protein